MQVEIKDINQCYKELKITVPAEEAKKDYMVVLNKFKNYVVVPGYRRGKAPLSMVTNMYSGKAKETYISEKVVEYYKQAIEEHKIEPLFDPEIIDVKWEPNEDLTATFRYEIAPDIKITNYKGLDIEFNPIPFSEELVDESILDFLEKDTRVDNDCPAVEADTEVSLSVEFTDPEDAERVIPNELAYVSMDDHNFGDEFHNIMLGKKKDDIIEISVPLDDDKLHPVKLTIDEIARYTEPEVTEEYVKEAGFQSIEDFRNHFKEIIEKGLAEKNQEKKQYAVVTELLKQNHFDMPPSAVLEYCKDLAQPYAEHYKRPVEELAQEFLPFALNEMKTFYLFEELSKIVPVEITEADEKDMIETMAKGLRLSPEEYLEKNPGVTKQEHFVENMKKKKLYDYLFENNNFVPVKKKEEIAEAEETVTEQPEPTEES